MEYCSYLLQCHRGKAPPIDSQITIDDWVPILEGAAISNGWTQGKLLRQLAGCLRGRALQKRKLMDSKDKTTYQSTNKALRERLDFGSKTLAVLDFCHASQRPSEIMPDFLRGLELSTRQHLAMKIYQLKLGLRTIEKRTVLFPNGSTFSIWKAVGSC